MLCTSGSLRRRLSSSPTTRLISLDYIERQSRAAAEAAAEWMLNKRVEIDPRGTATHDDLLDE